MKSIILLFSFLSLSFLHAQVGVNTLTPDQMLDVNGKLKIGTDGKTPTEGTMRYVNGSFDGYTNTGWNSFTQKTSTLPSNPVPVACFINNTAPGNTTTCTFNFWSTGASFTSVPVGKILIITGIYPSPNGAAITNDFYALSIASYNSSGIANNYSRIRISSYDNESRSFSGDQAPLIVVRAGETLRVFNYGSSIINMAVSIRGFLVDDLNYD